MERDAGVVDTDGRRTPPSAGGVRGSERPLRNLTVVLGLLAILAALLGLVGMRFGITLLASVYPGYKTIALSAALFWIVTGSILFLTTRTPLRKLTSGIVSAVLAAIILIEVLELPFSILGSHSGIETLFLEIGTPLFGPSSSPISPVASILIILAAICLIILTQDAGRFMQDRRIRDLVGAAGTVVAITGFTFVLSYAFGDPLFYGTQIIPIAAFSALAAFFMGTGIVSAAGTAAFPLRFLTGTSTRARMLRIFVPLTIAIVIVQQILFTALSSVHFNNALLVAGSVLLFAAGTGFIVSRFSVRLGTALDRAEEALEQNNEELSAMNEELTASEEELRVANEELLKNEAALLERTMELAASNEELRAANEELGAMHEELEQNVDELRRSEELLRQNAAELRETLEEKEMLLSEIHHRVKNNLSAFISLLSLEGSYEETDAGKQLKKDLQNRARSMALIHETLYRTRKFSGVEMDLYLRTLVGQVTGTYSLPGRLEVNVDARGIVLDLSRATTCGLVVNELVTKSLKYAFAAPFDCIGERGVPCQIGVTLQKEAEWYVMHVADNGTGLPPGFDARDAKSLGLKLVNFLAKHQLRATTDIRSEAGTVFEFRFPASQPHRGTE